MNFLIFDTEQTYNYGYIVLDNDMKIILEEDLVITNNFENRKLIGENTYKRKKPIYEKETDCRFISSADGAKRIQEVLTKYKIDYIIAHNSNEDKRQLELLSQQTGIKFSDIPFYDSVRLVKFFFPNNVQTNLKDTISDITGLNIKQTHTALADCRLLEGLISPLGTSLPILIKYQDLFTVQQDDINQMFFSHLRDFFPFPKNIKEIQSIGGFNNSRGDKTKLNNFLRKMAELKFFELSDCIEYSEKTGKPLKTPGTIVSTGEHFDNLLKINYLYCNINNLQEHIEAYCINKMMEAEEDTDIVRQVEIYKNNLDKIYQVKAQNLEKEREELQSTVATLIIKKINPIIKFPFFNKELKYIKTLVANNDIQKLYEYFIKN